MFHLNEGYWFGSGEHQELFDEYFDALVPASGPASTPQGELLRAASQLIYDHYNNGSCNLRTDHSETLFGLRNMFSEDVQEDIELVHETLQEADDRDLHYIEDEFGAERVKAFERGLENITDAVVELIEETS